MDKTKLTSAERALRMNIRNFYLTATEAELGEAILLRQSKGETFVVDCLKELLDEVIAER